MCVEDLGRQRDAAQALQLGNGGEHALQANAARVGFERMQGETLLVELDRDDRTMDVALFFNKVGHFIRFNVFDGFRGPF
jgi:hypothetical protein